MGDPLNLAFQMATVVHEATDSVRSKKKQARVIKAKIKRFVSSLQPVAVNLIVFQITIIKEVRALF